jgi:hypothetical protein
MSIIKQIKQMNEIYHIMNRQYSLLKKMFKICFLGDLDKLLGEKS